MAYGEKAPFQAPASFSSQAPSPNYDRLLGWKYNVNGNEFKVVKSSAVFAIAGIQGLVCLDAGTTVKTHVVAAVAGAAAPIATIAGIASTAQLALAIGDYFLVQTAGRALVISGAAGMTANTAQITAAAGQVTDAGAITTAILGQIVGFAKQARTSGQT
ncbi:MAG TPA: hypothetical protein VHX44_15835, partial [Planctomycetota bacterium]|nr:hypothetical protein [Planctomycetota bacterium]